MADYWHLLGVLPRKLFPVIPVENSGKLFPITRWDALNGRISGAEKDELLQTLAAMP